MQNVNGTNGYQKTSEYEIVITSFPFKITFLLQSGLCKQDES